MIADPHHDLPRPRDAPLVDPRYGIVRSLRTLPDREDLPPALCRAQADVSDSLRLSSWASDDRSGGFAWDAPEAAQGAAVGEAIERYCGNLVPAGLRRASFDELQAAGERAVDPESLALFSDTQYEAPGFPFKRFDRRLRVLWTPGRRLRSRSAVDDAAVWVPASLVWVSYFGGRPTRDEPKTHATPFAGIAAGRDRATAETGALFELIERDAVSVAWHGGEPLPALEVPPWLRAKVELPTLRMRFVLVPSPFGVPVVGALAHQLDGDLVALGTAARADPVEAALKAAAEALQLIVASRILDDPASRYMRTVAAGAPGLGVKPWRRDRAYRRLYDDDWRDAWDVLCHLQLYHDPSVREPFLESLRAGPAIAFETVPSLAGEPRAEMIRRLAEAGHGPIAVDVTTPDVAACGFHVVRVVAPGLYGNAPAAFPYLGGPRLAAARAAGRVRRHPLPYA